MTFIQSVRRVTRIRENGQGVRHGAWLLAAVTFPQAILLFLSWRDFAIIRTELADGPADWYAYLAAISISMALCTAYGLYCWIRERAVAGRLVSPVLLIAHVCALVWFFTHQGHLYPSSVPAWIVSSDNGVIYALTFLIPAILYALLLGAYELTPRRDSSEGVGWNFAALVSVPLAVYLFMQIGGSLRVYGPDRFAAFVVPVLLIGATVVFLTLLLRGLIMLGRGRAGAVLRQPAVSRPFRALIGLVLPLAGLYLNNHGEIIGMAAMTHVFGDFDHLAFYLLACLNGVMLLLPERDDARYRAGLFLARLLCLPFTLYFCVVFMPYLPLSLLAIAFFGLGLLMLVPLALAFVHVRALIQDFRAIELRLGLRAARRLLVGGCLALLLWPALITASYWHERRTLTAALDHAHAPDYGREASDLDLIALRKTLLEIRRYKSSAGTPYLGLYYRWLVLDNLTLSDAKLDRMQLLFFGEIENPPAPRGIWGQGAMRGEGGGRLFGQWTDAPARLDAVETRTVYDPAREIFRSTVDLRLINARAGSRQAQYDTRFSLPAGAFITEYYLDIGEKRQFGMLAEKKSALWIYDRITARRLDPGLLHQEEGSDDGWRRFHLRVFPVAAGAARRSGFEILHLEPMRFELDGRRFDLSAPREPGPAGALVDAGAAQLFRHGVYLPGSVRAKLPELRRMPYYHFVLDCSSHGAPASTANQDDPYVTAIESLLRAKPLREVGRRIRFSCANFEARTISLEPEPHSREAAPEIPAASIARAVSQVRRTIPRRGSLALDRTLGQLAIAETRTIADREGFPVFVVVSPALEKAYVGEHSLRDLDWLFPEGAWYYSLDANERGDRLALRRHSLLAVDMDRGGGQAVTRIAFDPTVALDLPPVVDGGAGVGAASRRRVESLVLRRGQRSAVIPRLDRAIAPEDLPGALQTASAPARQDGERYESKLTRADLLELAAIERNHLLYPARAAGWRVAMLRRSMGAHVLLRQSSFLVVETRAQKLALERMQQRVMRGHGALDPDEEPLRMDEPGLWFFALLALGAGLFVFVARLLKARGTCAGRRGWA